MLQNFVENVRKTNKPIMSCIFLETGRHFNEYGNIVNWWSPEVEANFNTRADCIKEQYSSFVVPEVNKNVSVKATFVVAIFLAFWIALP